MKLYTKIFVLLIFLSACNGSKTKEQIVEQKKSKIIEYTKFNSQYSNKATLSVADTADSRFQLDSTQYVKWTDKYIPYITEFGRIYSAELYSVQPEIENFAVIAIRTDADDWKKMHLVTINSENELVDKVEVSNSWSDLMEQAGDVEIVGKKSMYTNMISGTEYQNIDIRTTEIINYYTDSTTYEIDSIVTKIEILDNGRFKQTKVDSIRKVTHSNKS